MSEPVTLKRATQDDAPLLENLLELSLDVAEFFVLRGYRRLGVGRQAAFALWDTVPGQWVVRVAEANRARQWFWTDVVASYAPGAFGEDAPRAEDGWLIFTFASRPRPERIRLAAGL